MMRHKKFNPWCYICQFIRSRRRPHFRKPIALGDRLTYFGEIVTCDHIVSETPGAKSIEGHLYALMFFCLFSKFIGAYPALTKTGMETLQYLQTFRGKDHIELIYSDNAGEIEFACRMERIPHDTCKAGDSKANGIAERQVQEVRLITAANLCQSGLPHPY